MNTSAATPSPVDLPVEAPEPIAPAEAAQLVEAGTLTSITEQGLTLVIFAFGLISLALFYLILRSERATPYLMRIYVIIILIVGTLLVVSSAYTTDQIAPVVGFFGTIAGYLLGRTDRPSPESADKS